MSPRKTKEDILTLEQLLEVGDYRNNFCYR